MHRTLKDSDINVRALRRAREMKEVSASLIFLALFPKNKWIHKSGGTNPRNLCIL